MIQVKPIKTNCRKGPLTLLELLGWLDISQTLLGPLQGDSLPENEVNSEQSRAKNDSWGERQRLMLDLVKPEPLLFLDFPLVFWPTLWQVEILVPRPGVKLVPPALETRSKGRVLTTGLSSKSYFWTFQDMGQ